MTRLTIIAMAVVLASCATTEDPLQRAFADNMARCKATTPVPPNTYAALGACINDGESKAAAEHGYRYPDLLQLGHAVRASLLSKVDSGELTLRESDIQFLELNSRMKSEEIRRDTSVLSAQAADKAADAAIFANIQRLAPTTCYGGAGSVTCY